MIFFSEFHLDSLFFTLTLFLFTPEFLHAEFRIYILFTLHSNSHILCKASWEYCVCISAQCVQVSICVLSLQLRLGRARPLMNNAGFVSKVLAP